MSILVTGGAGFIGSHTAVELLTAGFDVVIADNFRNSSPNVLDRIRKITGRDFKFYKCDIRDKSAVADIFKENGIEAVIHFAGLKAVGESVRLPISYYNDNLISTITLCEVMAEYGVKRLVFSSSATVYGMTEKSPLSESEPTGAVTNPYGRTKYFIEEILKDIYVSDPEWSIALLRYFNPIGAHESGEIGEDPIGIPNNLMPYITRVAVGKLPQLTVFGGDYPTPDGTCIRDYIHVVDLAQGHIAALDKLLNSTGLSVYNLGTGTGYSVLEVIHAFEKASGVKINHKIGVRRDGDLAVLFSDPSKITQELSWSAGRGIDVMCRDSWNWQKKNPAGFENSK